MGQNLGYNTTYELWWCECLVYAWWPIAAPGFGCGCSFSKPFFLLRVSLLPLNNVFIDVDTGKSNNVLSSNEHAQVDKDDRDKINVQDCDGDEDESMDKEEENFD